MWQKLAGTPWTEHDLPRPSRCTPRSQHGGRAVAPPTRAISPCIGWLHLLPRPAWSCWCLNLQVLMRCLMFHHGLITQLLLPAIWLLAPLLDRVLTISPVLDRLPPSSRILLPGPLRRDTHLFRKAGSMLFHFAGSSDSFHPELQALSLQS